MANKSNIKPKAEQESLFQKKQDARVKAFIQMLDIKRDTNITRIYSAIQSLKTT